MSLDDYNRLLAESGPLKLRATALLGRGDPESRFEAAAVLHEVVRMEQSALSGLQAPTPETQLGFAIERCWLLLDGLDPKGAREAWSDVLRLSERAPAAVAAALRDRINKRYRAVERELDKAVRDNSALFLGEADIPSDSKQRDRLRKRLKDLLKKYPGAYELWLNLHRLESQAGDQAEAAQAIARANKLRQGSASPKARAASAEAKTPRGSEPNTAASPEAIAFGREVRRRREASKMTLEQLSERSGLTPNYIGTIENGRRDPSLSTVLALAKGLGVPAAELVPGSSAMSFPAVEAGHLFDNTSSDVQSALLEFLRKSPHDASSASSTPALLPRRQQAPVRRSG